MLDKSLIVISLICIWGSIVYRFYALNNLGVFLTLFLSVIAYIAIFKVNKENWKLKTYPAPRCGIRNWKFSKILSFKFLLYFILFCTLLFFCFYILFTHQTIKSIVSPWHVMPWYFFIFYGLTAFILISFKNSISSFYLIFFYFLSFSIALIIYKLNYGFDPFIHQATLELINNKGFVDPKPFYYLGQYSLEIIIHKITHIPLFWLDKLLVPVLAAIFLPLALYKTLKEQGRNQSIISSTILSLLILPFSFLIVTTPQNLAYLFLLLIILLAISNIKFTVLFLLALASLVTQPIAGIPAVLFVFLLMIFKAKDLRIMRMLSSRLKQSQPQRMENGMEESLHNCLRDPSASLRCARDDKWFKKYIYILTFIFTIFILPALFYIFEKNNNLPKAIADSSASIKSFIPQFIIPNEDNIILNFVYLYAFNIKFFIGILVLIGVIIALKNKYKYKIYFLYFGMFLALFLSYFLTAILPFNFLIDYERSNYADRVLQVSIFFLLPFIILAMYKIISRIKQQNKFVQFSFAIFCALLIITSLYISYPRQDNYFNSRGYSTGNNDIQAVHWIENNATKNYIVLANQQVSAAALNEFGFKKYYKVNGAAREDGLGHKKDIFYYPVPTGAPLYQYYLDMVYVEPSRKTMVSAMDLAAVDTGYFVLNKYWWAFKKILDEAKLSADSWEEFGDGEVYVFKYLK